MISKTKISSRISRKKNPELVKTILLCKKGDELWMKVAHVLSGSKRKMPVLNLNEIDKKSSDGETVLVPGKVLSQGNVSKKIKIVAFNFSESTKEKLNKDKIKFNSIIEEIKSNPGAKGINFLK